jgi:hypothetical protein
LSGARPLRPQEIAPPRALQGERRLLEYDAAKA